LFGKDVLWQNVGGDHCKRLQNVRRGKSKTTSTNPCTHAQFRINLLANLFCQKSKNDFCNCTQGWTGLLVEANPDLFSQMKQKNRKSHLFGHCLSTKSTPGTGLPDGLFSNQKSQFWINFGRQKI
jgi:hypothetical protein